MAYPPTDRPDSRTEKGVALKRLRSIPYPASMLNKNGIYRDPNFTAVDFVKGAPVEVQWKAYEEDEEERWCYVLPFLLTEHSLSARQHFWGWWEGIVSGSNVQEQYV